MYICSSLTDSLVCEIKDPNKTFIEDLKSLSHIFDFSTLPKTHSLWNCSNEKEPGKLKIEFPYPLEFVAVKSKVYSVLNQCQICQKNETVSLECESCLESSTSKGCSRRKKTNHEVYRKAALQKATEPTVFESLKSINQQVTHVSIRKNIFVTKDSHRIWLDFNTSIPFGYEGPITDHGQKSFE